MTTPAPVVSCRRFAGKVALLTAAASGIGAATARRLAAEGAVVVVTDITDGSGQALVSELHAEGASAAYMKCDVTSQDDWARCLEHTIAEHGRLDVLHLNAGRNIELPLAEITDAVWDAQMDLGLRSAMLGVRACLPALRTSHGSVVATSSIHASRGLPGYPAYAAAKGGLEALVRQMAADYGPDVRFNAVSPGAIWTPLWAGVSDGARRDVVERTPLRRFGTPDDVAAAVAFLASDDAAFVTGATLVVDGGRTIAERG